MKPHVHARDLGVRGRGGAKALGDALRGLA